MIEISHFAPIFLTITVSGLLLGIYVYVKGRGSPINRAFLYFSVLFSIGSLLELFMASFTEVDEVIWVARIMTFLLIIQLGVGYYLNSMVPFDTGTLLIRNRSGLYPLAVLAFASLLALTIGVVEKNQYGWAIGSLLSLVGISASLLIYATLIIISLWRKLSIVRNDVKRRQVELFGLALVFPAGLMFILLPLTQLGWSLPHIFGIGELVSVVVLGYAISHYHLMVPPRVRENASIRYRRVPALEKGHAYLFESQDPSRMFDSVLQEMEEGLSVLIICRTHPDQLRAQYQLTQTPMIWLAQSPGPDRIDPCNLQMLTHVIMKYMSKERSLIAIEGLEYLMVNNELNKLLRFIGQLRDNIIVENSILLVTVDPRTLTDRLQAILQRELESVVEKEGAETAI